MARRRRWPPVARRRSQSKDTASPRARVGPGKEKQSHVRDILYSLDLNLTQVEIFTPALKYPRSIDQLLTVGGSIGHVSQIAIYRSEAWISIQAIGATILKSQAACLKSLIKPIKTKPKKQFEAGSKVD